MIDAQTAIAHLTASLRANTDARIALTPADENAMTPADRELWATLDRAFVLMLRARQALENRA